MKDIPAGSFLMGCDDKRDPSCSPTEQPVHSVHVAAFRIDELEVTRAAYFACIKAGACAASAANLDETAPAKPITGVTWTEADRFCMWMERRLPTEQEWELAARGTDGRIYPWGDSAPECTQAHTRKCGTGPSEVGNRPSGASPFGAQDMAGNVDEWVHGYYGSYGAAAAPSTPKQRIARGGAYDAWHSRSAARNALDENYRDAWLGFRCAAD